MAHRLAVDGSVGRSVAGGQPRRGPRRWAGEEALPADVRLGGLGLLVYLGPGVGGDEGAAVLPGGVGVLLLAGGGGGGQLPAQGQLPLRPLGLRVIEPRGAGTVVRGGGGEGAALVVLVKNEDNDDDEDEDHGDEDPNGHAHVLCLPPGLQDHHLVLQLNLRLRLHGLLDEDLVLLRLVVLFLHQDRGGGRRDI